MDKYITASGDTWDMIAKRVYGDEKHAGYLMEMNTLLIDYLTLPGGLTLFTPELPEQVDCDQPIWRA